MSKLVIKIIVMMVVVLGMSNYMMYIMTGKMPFSAAVTSLSTPSLSDLTPSLPAGKDTAYKWTDENGVVHYSSEPPAQADQAVKKLEVDPNTNLVQGLKPQQPEAAETVQPTPAPGQPMVPGGAQKLLEDAKNVQKLLDERYEKQKKAMGD